MRAPGLARQRVRIIGLAADARAKLAAHPLQRIGVEPRLIQGEAQQLKGGVNIPGQRPQPAGESVAVRPKRQLDRLLLQRLLEGGAVKRARAFVKQTRQHGGGASLARRILRAAAAHGKFQRHQGHGVIFNQPCGDTLGRDKLLDSGGAGRGAYGSGTGGHCNPDLSGDGRRGLQEMACYRAAAVKPGFGGSLHGGHSHRLSPLGPGANVSDTHASSERRAVPAAKRGLVILRVNGVRHQPP